MTKIIVNSHNYSMEIRTPEKEIDFLGSNWVVNEHKKSSQESL